MTLSPRNMRLLTTLIATISVMLAGCDPGPAASDDSAATEAGGMRIVSMAPSLTETLFALGLGDQVVGVTDFCDFPPAAQKKPTIGGLYDANYERIAALAPDLVIVLKEHEEARQHCRALGLDFLEVHNRSVDSILETIRLIGKRCSAVEKAAELEAAIRHRIATVKKTAATHDNTPRVLVVIGRAMGSGRIKDTYVAGAGSLYEELVQIAGGVNVYDGRLEYPMIGAEGLTRLDPDVIIDLAAGLESKGLNVEDVRREWQELSSMKAVANDRVYVLTGDYVTVPGPRFIILLEDLAGALHPEARFGGMPAGQPTRNPKE